MPLPLAAALGIGAASGLVSSVGNMISNQQQVKQAKELYDYQQERYLSPAAQVRNTTAAGLNPAQMFGNTAPVNVGGQMALPDAQPYGLHVGTQALSEIANMMVGVANAKKAGVDTTNVEHQTEGVILDNERKRMENDFVSRYGLEKSAAELALAQQQVELAMASTDVQKQEKAKKNWEIAKEKALSECQEAQRDILRKELDNTDERLRLQNQKMEEEAKTERSKQSANYAGAEASKAAASNYREQARANAVLADIQEATSVQQIDTQIQKLLADKFISKTDSEEAKQKLQAIQNMRDNGAREKIDDLLQWLKARINIFK